MELRQEGRLKSDRIATVQVVGGIPGPILKASILNVSGSGMRLRSELPIPCGALVEIEAYNVVSRGSVCRCEPADEAYELGVLVAETAPVAAFLNKD